MVMLAIMLFICVAVDKDRYVYYFILASDY